MELPYNSVILLLGIYLKKLKTLIQKNMCTPVHCSIIYNSQDLEAAQVTVSRWVDKKAVVHLHNEILLGRNEEVNLTLRDSMDEPRE